MDRYGSVQQVIFILRGTFLPNQKVNDPVPPLTFNLSDSIFESVNLKSKVMIPEKGDRLLFE
jgi:hypothetical protein